MESLIKYTCRENQFQEGVKWVINPLYARGFPKMGGLLCGVCMQLGRRNALARFYATSSHETVLSWIQSAVVLFELATVHVVVRTTCGRIQLPF